MGYRRALLTRWSRRDKLAILVIAVTIGFLTGTTLIIAAASTQTTTIAQEYGMDGTAVHYDSVAQARNAAGKNALVVPMATVELPNGETRYVAGISDRGANRFERNGDISIPHPPKTGVSSGTREARERRRLAGNRRTLTVAVTPRDGSPRVVPDDWFVAGSALVNRLGPSGAFVITPVNGDGTGVPKRGVTLQSALAFFVVGTRQLLTVLSIVAAGGAVLVGMTVFSVTRMTVRDRLRTIRVLRSTGCRPRTVLLLFSARATLLTGAGVGVGYAIGMILPNVAVSLATVAGLPTILEVRLSRLVLTVLLPLYVCTGVVAFVAGAVAVWPAVRSSPSRPAVSTDRNRPSGETREGVVRRLFALRLLDWRAVAPSVATLTVFVTVVFLTTSMVGVVMPLMGSHGTTITEPGAPHPIASEVPQQYADALRSRGIPASPEMLLFTVNDGRPIVTRAVNYSAHTTVSNATIEDGRRPKSVDEAVIGVGLARTLGVDVGDRLTLGGSTEPGIAMVRVVGTYSAPGVSDDQLLVSLPMGRHLLGKTGTTVQMIRAAQGFRSNASSSSVAVVNVSAPGRVRPNTSVPIRLQLRNFGSEETTHSVRVRLGAASKSVSVTLAPNTRRIVTVRLPTPRPGTTTLRAGDVTKPIRVASPDSIRVGGLPAKAPPHSAPLVSVSTVDGTPVANATIRLPNATVRTGSDGTARLPLASTGSYTVRVSARGQTVTRRVTVSRTARRTVTGSLQIHPTDPSVLSRTEARVRVSNPWNETLTRRIRLVGDVDSGKRTVSVPPGETRTAVFDIGEQAPGTYSVRVTSDGHDLSSTSYTVRGDERLIAAYSNGGRSTGGTGIERAIRSAFGNLQLLFAVLLLLAGVMTVGSTTAVFAQAVQAQRQAIGVHRATGASPTRLLRLIAIDALTIGCVAVSGALVLGIAIVVLLARLNYLVLFGVRIPPTVTPNILLGTIVGGLAIILLSVGFVAGTLLIQSPATLVRNMGTAYESGTVMGGRGSDE